LPRATRAALTPIAAPSCARRGTAPPVATSSSRATAMLSVAPAPAMASVSTMAAANRLSRHAE
jgi:hypothetical protein